MMMICKIFLVISLLIATSINTFSFERESFESVDCDSFNLDSGIDSLISFVIQNDLQYDYDRRNDNYEACFDFLSKFNSLINQKKNEEEEEEEEKLIKRTNSLNGQKH
jgi:hypothetical protein